MSDLDSYKALKAEINKALEQVKAKGAAGMSRDQIIDWAYGQVAADRPELARREELFKSLIGMRLALQEIVRLTEEFGGYEREDS